MRTNLTRRLRRIKVKGWLSPYRLAMRAGIFNRPFPLLPSKARVKYSHIYSMREMFTQGEKLRTKGYTPVNTILYGIRLFVKNEKGQGDVRILIHNKTRQLRHERAHGREALFYFQHGREVNPQSALAYLGEDVARALGPYSKDFTPFVIPLTRRQTVPMDYIRVIEYENNIWLPKLMEHFSNEYSFLRAVVRLSNDPIMEPVLRDLNELPLNSRGVHDASSKLIDYFEAYLKKYPQK